VATADLTVFDIISFARVCVVEDKSLTSDFGLDSILPQLIAESIACLQHNLQLAQTMKYGKPEVTMFSPGGILPGKKHSPSKSSAAHSNTSTHASTSTPSQLTKHYLG
jgi:hypothetical protein